MAPFLPGFPATTSGVFHPETRLFTASHGILSLPPSTSHVVSSVEPSPVLNAPWPSSQPLGIPGALTSDMAEPYAGEEKGELIVDSGPAYTVDLVRVDGEFDLLEGFVDTDEHEDSGDEEEERAVNRNLLINFLPPNAAKHKLEVTCCASTIVMAWDHLYLSFAPVSRPCLRPMVPLKK